MSKSDSTRKPHSPPDKRHSYRSRYRAAAHHSAHADDADHHDHVLDHPMVAGGAAELITTPDALGRLIEHVRAIGSFAYDSEFIGELTYHPRLCLIQVATTQRIGLIDPLAPGLELREFWELICDPAVETIVHAGDQDIEPGTRILGRRCANVFDTQIAAGFVGMAYPVSLAKLVQEVVGAKLGKGLTFTHWDQRPLSAQQLRYAANDVRYLPQTRAEIGRRLAALGHESWARDECEKLCDPSHYQFDPESEYLRIRGAGSLAPSELAVLRELTNWRDAAAQRADVPPRAFLRDDVLLELARRPAKSVDRLDRVRGLPRPVEREHGQTIVELTSRALATPLAALRAVKQVEPTPTERFRIDALWSLVQVICTGQQIDPALVASRADIVELHRLLHGGSDVNTSPIFQGWRRAAVGEKLLQLVRESKSMTLTWANESLRVN
jgi:ribonuclease D